MPVAGGAAPQRFRPPNFAPAGYNPGYPPYNPGGGAGGIGMGMGISTQRKSIPGLDDPPAG
jgi:hypothetical protein